MILGRDSRVSGPWVEKLVEGILVALGYKVINIGIAPTPTVQYIVKKYKADGGIVITSSHNDVMWNGLKFIESGDGLFISPEKCELLFDLADKNNQDYPQYDKMGSVETNTTAIKEHIDCILNLPYIDTNLIKSKKYKVCVDSVNGAGGPAITQLLKEFGCEVIGINLETSGIFAHNPEPIPSHLTQLSDIVIKNKADIGIAVDPDVDRCVLIDNNGVPLGEEYTLALAVKFYLQNCKKTTVCKNLSSSRAIDDIAKQYQCDVIATAVGEINVAKKMIEIGSTIGGEGNGGVMLADVHIGRDALVATALTLMNLALFNGTIDQLKATLPQYEIIKLKAPIEGIDANKIVDHFKNKWNGKAKLNTEDGLHISTEDWWVHLRKSNTEPIIRVIGEAKGGKQQSDFICNQFLNEILEFSNSK